jgi:O-acetyl-ADP-ribose deacetylase (regulator of RNase III)
MQADAIVNAANTALQMGGGVCGAIFKEAGTSELQAACDKLAPIQTGDAVITPGFGLSAKFVIHTAGPVYRGGNHGEEEQLRLCYINSLKLAIENKCKSVAFPLISSGIYGYPKGEALRVATSAIKDFLRAQDLDVYLVVFDKAAFAVGEDLLGEVESYIDEHYVEEHKLKRRELLDVERSALYEADFINYNTSASMQAPTAGVGIDNLISNLDKPFSATLLKLIDAKGKTDVEIYKRANLDRKLFSKIRTGKGTPAAWPSGRSGGRYSKRGLAERPSGQETRARRPGWRTMQR